MSSVLNYKINTDISAAADYTFCFGAARTVVADRKISAIDGAADRKAGILVGFMKKEDVVEILQKRARGYTVCEVAEEFADVDGRLVAVKKKVSEKYIPPDLSSLKLLLEMDGEREPELSVMQLEEEKKRLLEQLREQDEQERKSGGKDAVS